MCYGVLQWLNSDWRQYPYLGGDKDAELEAQIPRVAAIGFPELGTFPYASVFFRHRPRSCFFDLWLWGPKPPWTSWVPSRVIFSWLPQVWTMAIWAILLDEVSRKIPEVAAICLDGSGNFRKKACSNLAAKHLKIFRNSSQLLLLCWDLTTVSCHCYRIKLKWLQRVPFWLAEVPIRVFLKGCNDFLTNKNPSGYCAFLFVFWVAPWF